MKSDRKRPDIRGLVIKALARIGLAMVMIVTAEFAASADTHQNPPLDPAHQQFALGQRPFAATSSWNTPIAAHASFEKLAWPRSARFGVAWSSYSPAIRVAMESDPVVAVEYPPGWGYPGGTLHIRMPDNATGASGTDGELLVIDGATVHNFWQFRRLGPTTAAARSYGATNVLAGSGWGRKSSFLGAGIVAAGSSQLAGLLVQAETDRGEITHALQVSIESSLAKPGRSGEAISGDGKNPDGLVQEGERLAVPASVPMPQGLSPLGQKVFRAYQTYGAFVIDVAGGVTNLRAQANAYDRATITALQRDLERIGPMLERVEETSD